jgi:hypothetical protein
MKNSLLKSDLLKLREQLENIENEIENPQNDQKVQDNFLDDGEANSNKKFSNPEEQIEELISTKEDIITLNIGGKKFQTKKSTLLRLKDTLFYNLIIQYKNMNQEIPKEIFIDRGYTHFKLILDILRTNQFTFKGRPKIEREELLDEFEYYGLKSHLNLNKKKEIDIKWDQGLSKSGACTIDQNDPKKIKIHSTTCYTHFVTNPVFSKENFIIEFDSTVTQTDNYYYIGLINESYSTSGSCMCCNPSNSFYIQCDGSVHINATKHNEQALSWNGANVNLGMKVNLEEKKIWFYIPDRKEVGPYTLNGNTFRVVAGHCNTGNGMITITDCYEMD